ncbi:DUF4190 domain-containing protein [Nocardioides sp. R-C-SC26]|uniref:DUF4190 domain-containing protein n=1 Tax=Nocardioides sp. R-C-SC26 TaxID=2870414 RepID=UPI001E29BE7D|nr:DUF4190 domain-containing protein [Nocardioides sp. R-C-SC26]
MSEPRYSEPEYSGGAYPPYVPVPAAQQVPQNHPSTIIVLVLGIVSVTVMPLVAPVAWVMGRRALREIDASNGWYTGRSEVMVGYIIGIVVTCLMLAGVVAFAGLMSLVVIAAV